jgi:glyoxylase-like metal-dependent hydrolase (beta-lactamase superfamily II)
MLEIKRFVCGPLSNNVYLLINPATREAALVDPGIGTEEVQAYLESEGLALRAILITHAHFDHVYSLAEWKQRFPEAVVYMHPADNDLLARLPLTVGNWGFPEVAAPPPPEVELADGGRITILGQEMEVRHTPGHCAGNVVFYWPGHAIVGDTLFRRGIGRYDLPGCSFAELERSIKEQLYTLPPETVVYPGHNELTTIGEEIRHNPFVGQNVRFAPVGQN